MSGTHRLVLRPCRGTLQAIVQVEVQRQLTRKVGEIGMSCRANDFHQDPRGGPSLAPRETIASAGVGGIRSAGDPAGRPYVGWVWDDGWVDVEIP